MTTTDTPGPGTDSLQVLRPRFIGLPLQRSLFYRVADAGAALGLSNDFPPGAFGVRVDDNGDLLVDRAHLSRAKQLFGERLDEERLAGLQRDLRSLRDRALAPAFPAGASAVDKLGRVGAIIADFCMFGILSKFVPDALHRAFERRGGEGPPPFPRESAGLRLTRALLELRSQTLNLPETTTAPIAEFCSRWRGYGPLAWDAPGFEDPDYVRKLLETMVDDRARPPVPVARAAPRPPEWLHNALAEWLDFLEQETYLVRRLFFVEGVPLLRRIAEEWRSCGCDLAAEDLLFLTIDELRRPPAATTSHAIQSRRRHYDGDEDYWIQHGIRPGRLRCLMDL